MKLSKPEIKYQQTIILGGIQSTTNYAEYNPYPLWNGFIRQLKEINYDNEMNLYSVDIYDKDFFGKYHPHNTFEKWAAVEFSEKLNRTDFEVLTVPERLYAVFTYQGNSSQAKLAYDYIFLQWLPDSGFDLDDRPHLAVMGEKYQNNSDYSEEELRIPVKPKN